MKKLRVLVRFRDERNFFTIHEEGDTIMVDDPDRVTRLIEGGFCEEVEKEMPKADASDSTELEVNASEQTVEEKPAEEKPKRAYRKKKEA